MLKYMVKGNIFAGSVISPFAKNIQFNLLKEKKTSSKKQTQKLKN